jgi:ATP-dependent DNA ligase
LPRFAQTQAATDGERGVHLVYYAFDLLHLGGWDVSNLQLIERKALLEPLVKGKPGLQFNGHEAGDGELILKHAGKLGFEGVVSKTIDAPYAPETAGYGEKRKRSIAKSSSSWVGRIRKERGLISERCCSVTTPMTASSSMPAAWAQGMSVKVLADLRRRLDPLARKTSPLSVPPPRSTRYGSPARSVGRRGP